jgi:hypothetical protein
MYTVVILEQLCGMIGPFIEQLASFAHKVRQFRILYGLAYRA